MTFPTEGTARRALQRATKPAHDRLHRNVSFARLLRGDLTLPAYRNLLVRLLGLHQPIEESLERLGADPLLAWRVGISRATLLRTDLAALGLGQHEIKAAPCAYVLLPPLIDPASALGCAWVVEGSALGGRVMSTNVDKLLSLTRSEGGGAFLSSDPDQPARWRACCEAVEACGAQPDDLAAMIRAAVSIFAIFEAWLDTTGHG